MSRGCRKFREESDLIHEGLLNLSTIDIWGLTALGWGLAMHCERTGSTPDPYSLGCEIVKKVGWSWPADGQVLGMGVQDVALPTLP